MAEQYWSADDIIKPLSNAFPNMARIFEEELDLLLLNSDSGECNRNLSSFLKIITDIEQYKDKLSHHQLAIYAMKLINSNLFIKNFTLCIGKMLSLLTVFTEIQNYNLLSGETTGSDCDTTMKELLCITLLLMLKVKNPDEEEECLFNESIETEHFLRTLKELKLIVVCGNFLSSQLKAEERSYILVKFMADIIFEYLYKVELLSDAEFDGLVSNTDLINILINSTLRDVDLTTYYWDDEKQLISYEMFKLILLINEQYLMKSYSSPSIRNKVFDGLISIDSQNTSDSINSKISGFMNLLVFHLNREESHIIKILILKFLYLIFTSSYTAKLYYLNDLKILIDVFVRELNDIEYVEEVDAENRILILTYLKVLYPMLIYSQLSELKEVYKSEEILSALRNIILNSTVGNDTTPPNSSKQLNQIAAVAKKCMDIKWIKQGKKAGISQSSSSSSLSSLTAQTSNLVQNPSDDSIANSFTRTASVRASSRSDYHLQTTFHNVNSRFSSLRLGESPPEHNIAKENNGNVFLGGITTNTKTIHDQHNTLQKKFSNILDLPNEYLKQSQAESKLVRKAVVKRAPPPPPPHSPTNRKSIAVSPASPRFPQPEARASRSLTSSPKLKPCPPPPPPRRRGGVRGNAS